MRSVDCVSKNWKTFRLEKTFQGKIFQGAHYITFGNFFRRSLKKTFGVPERPRGGEYMGRLLVLRQTNIDSV